MVKADRSMRQSSHDRMFVEDKAKRCAILAHRGYWQAPEEHNTLEACARALEAGYGIEIDIRDADGQLVVAHDVNDPRAYPFARLLELCSQHPECCVAINIKSSGLQPLLGDLLNRYQIHNYFTFDMAPPDLQAYHKQGLISFTRHSDFEKEPVLYSSVEGVWLDMMESDWLTEEAVMGHMRQGKKLAVVSPELHGRPHIPFWQAFKKMISSPSICSYMNMLYLCTDHPQEASRFFNDA